MFRSDDPAMQRLGYNGARPCAKRCFLAKADETKGTKTMPVDSSNLIIPSLEGLAGTLDLETVAALGLSRIEGADTLDIPLVGRLSPSEVPALAQIADAVPSVPFPARLGFGMKERRPQATHPIVHYDQSFFI